VTTTDAERHFTIDELEGRLPAVHGAPVEVGRVELVIRRPAEGRRELLDEATLDLERGVVGDRWSLGRSNGRPPNLLAQVTLMSARAADLVAGEKERWPLAGDQLYVDLHLGGEELPPGTRLRIGTAVVEITDQPHRGCATFTRRFGLDAMRLVNSDDGVRLNLRGVNAKVVVPGTVTAGDRIEQVDALVGAE
jgi:MOSC domain-containing protein YiiM